MLGSSISPESNLNRISVTSNLPATFSVLRGFHWVQARESACWFWGSTRQVTGVKKGFDVFVSLSRVGDWTKSPPNHDPTALSYIGNIHRPQEVRGTVYIRPSTYALSPGRCQAVALLFPWPAARADWYCVIEWEISTPTSDRNVTPSPR